MSHDGIQKGVTSWAFLKFNAWVCFLQGHTKVVKYLVDHVTQFPSDADLTRYINTLSDKVMKKIKSSFSNSCLNFDTWLSYCCDMVACDVIVCKGQSECIFAH